MPQGASTHLYLALAPELNEVSGQYFVDCHKEGWVHVGVDRDPQLGEKLWKRSVGLTGMDME